MTSILKPKMEEWGHPIQVSQAQKVLWERMKILWNKFCGLIPEPSLDIGAASKKGRTVSLDPYPRGDIDVRAIAEFLPFKDNYFVSIVLESVLKHVINPEKVLSEARRVSRNNSYLFFTSPVNVTDKHRHSFTSSEVISLLDRAGYKVVKKRGIGLASTRLDKLLRRVSITFYLFIRVPLRYCRVVFLVCKSKS